MPEGPAADDDLLVKLEDAARNLQHMTTMIACLIKKHGEVVVDGHSHGYKVFITDEELVAMDGQLEAHHSVPMQGTVLMLRQSLPEKDGATT